MTRKDEELIRDMKIAIGSINIEIMRIKNSKFSLSVKNEEIAKLLKKKNKAVEVIQALQKRNGVTLKP